MHGEIHSSYGSLGTSNNFSLHEPLRQARQATRGLCDCCEHTELRICRNCPPDETNLWRAVPPRAGARRFARCPIFMTPTDVSQTPRGTEILRNFAIDICGAQ